MTIYDYIIQCLKFFLFDIITQNLNKAVFGQYLWQNSTNFFLFADLDIYRQGASLYI